MRVLELFKGTGSLSKYCEANGCLSTTIRANLDYVFVFSTHNRNEREAVFNEIGIGSFGEFNKGARPPIHRPTQVPLLQC